MVVLKSHSAPEEIALPIMDNETSLQIRQKALDFYRSEDSSIGESWTVEDIYINRYYGNYNGAVVVLFGAPFINLLAWGGILYIDGIEFHPGNNTILIFKDDAVYSPLWHMSLRDAYADGVLSKDDLMTISKLNKKYPPQKNY